MLTDDPRRIGMTFNGKAGEYMLELEAQLPEQELVEALARIEELEAEKAANWPEVTIAYADLKALREAATECDGYNCCPLAPELKALREAAQAVVDKEREVRRGAPKYRTTEPELGRLIDALAAALEVKS